MFFHTVLAAIPTATLHRAWPFPPYFIIAPDIRRARLTKSVAFFGSTFYLRTFSA
ncbi:hypothetical protein Agau_P200396 (plasmid) [Agrobacterium tumefaciens F2]|nr:hypothetical protein Agau_P200396 [Agrobacterium tumefaciens F2]